MHKNVRDYGMDKSGAQIERQLVVTKRTYDFTAAEARSRTAAWDQQYLPFGYKRRPEDLATEQQDCAGLILQRLITDQVATNKPPVATGKYIVFAPTFFEKFIAPFGRLLESNEPRKVGDILVFYQRATWP